MKSAVTVMLVAALVFWAAVAWDRRMAGRRDSALPVTFAMLSALVFALAFVVLIVATYLPSFQSKG